MEHGGFFVVIIPNPIDLIEFIVILGAATVLIVESATPDCARLRTVEGVAPFPVSFPFKR